jgi:hypothetical protein
VIHEVGRQTGFLNLGGGHFPGELMDDGRHHLEVTQFLCAYIGTLIDYLAFLWYNIENHTAIKEFSYVY